MRLGGLQKMTLLDFPGRVACTVFTLGCNFRCPFCHNTPLVLVGGADSSAQAPQNDMDGRSKAPVPAEISQEEFFAFLKKRQGLLDGVAITGGEPLLHPDAAEFIERIRSLGYAVKLDTNGAFPDRLREMIDRGLVDYVAVDIKNSREKYALTIGEKRIATPVCGLVRNDGASENTGLGKDPIDCHDQCAHWSRNDKGLELLDRVEQTIALLRENRVDYEFRTTLVDELHEPSDFEAIGQWIQGAPRYFIQQFVDSGDILGGENQFHAASPEKANACLEKVRKYIPNAELRGLF